MRTFPHARTGLSAAAVCTTLLLVCGCSGSSTGSTTGSNIGSGSPNSRAEVSAQRAAELGPAPRHLKDAGPPPGTRLDPGQIADAVPRSEPPSRYGNPATYSVFGQQYRTMTSAEGFSERGLASWYGTKFHGRRTSSGEPYDMYAMTAAHKSLPLPSYVEVTNLENGERAIVRVNDRGPFHRGRVIDLSYAAAVKLGVHSQGTAEVEIRVLTADDAPARRTSSTAVAAKAVPLTPGRDTPTVISVVGPAEVIAPAVIAPGLGAAPATVAAAQAIDQPAEVPAWYLQVGAFSNRDNAETLRSRLIAANLPAPNISEAQSASRTVYRLRIGPLPSQRDADDLLSPLAQAGVHDPQLLQR